MFLTHPIWTRPGWICAILSLAVLTACGNGSTNPPGGGGGGGGGGRTYVITYSGTATGDGSWSRVMYNNGLGAIITDSNPQPAWTNQIQMNPGDTISVTAIGSVATGQLLISVTGNDGVGGTVAEGDVVTGDGTMTTYTLLVAAKPLP